VPSLFTKIVNGEIPSYKVAETDRFLAFLDVFPLAKGHVLVIPKQEIDYIFDIDDAQLAELHVFAKSVARKMQRVLPCERIGMAVIGLEVPHAHIHLIPLKSVEDINFSRPKLKFSTEEMESIAESIRTA
jgi:histidine triad (HIT) family protein